MHCCRFVNAPRSRRDVLMYAANGFGAVALTALLAERGYADALKRPTGERHPLVPRNPHFAPKAKNIIFLYMDGGPSQVDTFDPKPRLDKENGQPIKMDVPRGLADVGHVLKSPWKFKQYGESGIPVSDLFPKVAGFVDELCVIRSMVSRFFEHAAANLFLHSGHGRHGRPSMGSWVTYGLGSECRNLPGYVVLSSGMVPSGGVDCLRNGFLPTAYQCTVFKSGDALVSDIKPPVESADSQKRRLALLKKINQHHFDRTGRHDELEAAIGNFELAFRMQTAVPDLADLSDETKATHSLYGLDDEDPSTQTFGRQCLIARRLVERGVRFIELLCPEVGEKIDRWDQHDGLKDGHERNAHAVDQPIAGLLKDLKSRDLLKETLVIWAGEFGRTPMAQGTTGRDHNQHGFTIWMAGGGVKSGMIYGATDEFGYHAVEDPVAIHDLHATMLHLLGLDHESLTYNFAGADMRLTDVHGRVVHDIIS